MARPIDFNQIKRILITRTDRIGDLVLATPVFPAIKKRFPASYVAALVFKETAPLVQNNPWIDRVIVYDKKGIDGSWWNTVRFGFRLRSERFDAAIHLHPTNRAHLLSFLAGIPVRIGYRKKSDRLLTHTIEERKWQGKRHEADYNFDLLELIGVVRPAKFELYLPLVVDDQTALERIAPHLAHSRYVVFHPSASSISKIWPPERMAQVADRLAETVGVLPVIIGEGKGKNEAQKMIQAMRQAYLDLSGRLSLGMIAWLMKGARLVISNDSGPVHMASAVGTPVISIFGRNQPGLGPLRWRPLGEHSSFLQKDVGCTECLADDCQIDFKCLKELKVEEVVAEAKKYESFLA